MLSRWPIRVKLLVGLGLLVLLVGILAFSGLFAMYAYRELAKSVSWRMGELPVAARLSRQVGDLRITLSELRGLREGVFAEAEQHAAVFSATVVEQDPFAPPNPARGVFHESEPEEGIFAKSEQDMVPMRARMIREEFRVQLDQLELTVAEYRDELLHQWRTDTSITDIQPEVETLEEIETALKRVHEFNRNEGWILDDLKVGLLDAELEQLQALAVDLPSHLSTKLGGLAEEVRLQYRTLIVVTWIASVIAALLFLLIMRLSWLWVLQPLQILIHGSRVVAAGQFGYRIHLNTRDEMSELAEALNAMTARFQDIRDDLDRQVQERTKQVVRSEQLASVGFLAAGVAHEINNPLASIAMCAESLQSRVGDLLDPANPDHQIVSSYLQMVQDEAFRCKGITEKLLDFSRIGEIKRQNADLGELVRGVVDMVGHLGKYQRKRIQFVQHQPVVAEVNMAEIKQVALNLLTNALDSLEDDGTVEITLAANDGYAELIFADNGCGMTPSVLQHVFKPFFSRRRAGQGTGLGLSITYRIVSDHGGEIQAESPGPGQGSTFRVRLPMTEIHKEVDHQYQAA